MNVTIRPQKKRTVPDDAARIGVDDEGRTHYWAAGAKDQRVFVATDDAVDVYDLNNEPVGYADWLEHVDSWQTLDAEKSLADLFREQRETAR